METSKCCSYPECSVDGPIVVLYAPVEVRSCDEHWPALYKHYLTGKKRSVAGLGQTVESWTHIDKKTGNEVKHKITTGKQFEIVNRELADDGKTVINKKTGKPAQY